MPVIAKYRILVLVLIWLNFIMKLCKQTMGNINMTLMLLEFLAVNCITLIDDLNYLMQLPGALNAG